MGAVLLALVAMSEREEAAWLRNGACMTERSGSAAREKRRHRWPIIGELSIRLLSIRRGIEYRLIKLGRPQANGMGSILRE